MASTGEYHSGYSHTSKKDPEWNSDTTPLGFDQFGQHFTPMILMKTTLIRERSPDFDSEMITKQYNIGAAIVYMMNNNETNVCQLILTCCKLVFWVVAIQKLFKNTSWCWSF